jgi:hypothetical protein
MAVILNAKGTSQSSFRIGKRGSRIYGTSDAPSDVNNISTGDLWFDSSNTLLKIATVSGSDVAWNMLDAGTVDGINSTSFARVDQTPTFATDVVISGNLTVNGTQTVVNTQTLNIADNEIVLNSDLASNQAATANAGILVNRGNEGNVYVRWDEDEGEWTVNGQTFSAGTFVGNLSGNVTGSIQPNGVPNVVRANTLIVRGSTATAKFGDNAKANFGDGDDLQIYHDGSNSYIDDAGTGSIKLRSGTLTISNLAGSKTSALFASGGAQTLYHNNNQKFETTSTGITVTGTVNINSAYTFPTSDGSANQVLTTDGSGTLSFGTVNATPGGSNTHVQYNDSGSFGGSSTFTYDESEAKLSVGGSVASILFETVSDYGAITTSATDSVDYGLLTESVVALVNSDYGVVESSGGPVEFPQYTVAGVPSASAYTGHMIYVSNETGGSVMAFSDGSNWRRVTDRAVIS